MILSIILYTIGIYFLGYSIYWFVSVLIAYLVKNKVSNSTELKPPKDIWVILPAYNPNSHLLKVVESIKKAESTHKIWIYVLLQENKTINPSSFEQKDDIFIEEKSFKNLSGNPYHNALQFIVGRLEELEIKNGFECSHIVLLDKDNVVDKQFFNKHITGINAGFNLIQGQRRSYKSSSISQAYDTISEGLNDLMFRVCKTKLGWPIEISGSGFSCEKKIFADAVNQLDKRAPGMDKNLMVQLLKQNKSIKMTYEPQAFVWDEKTSKIEDLKKQRSRWFGNQYFNAYYHSVPLLLRAFKFRKFSIIDYAITLWRPPRSFQLFLLPLFAAIECFYYVNYNNFYTHIPIFTLGFGFLALAIILSLNYLKAWSHARKIIFAIPKITFNNLLSIRSGISKKNQGNFVNTAHEELNFENQNNALEEKRAA
ncbi:glycosyltransferase family 2 protein [Flexithrix dorotheae]|uniref:glycosyltransferase family 2 protein n=1 Tax=Flexithrix dorotheae TaxID=70993 RepID=UPI0003772676|nr:glycosyltransferase family 2 protein [Flexithrix dorotheae]